MLLIVQFRQNLVKKIRKTETTWKTRGRCEDIIKMNLEETEREKIVKLSL
jgi:hypothetical protein